MYQWFIYLFIIRYWILTCYPLNKSDSLLISICDQCFIGTRWAILELWRLSRPNTNPVISCSIFDVSESLKPNSCVSLAIGIVRQLCTYPYLYLYLSYAMHGPWLELGNRYKSWGAEALTQVLCCESCRARTHWSPSRRWSQIVGQLLLWYVLKLL